MTNLLRRLAFVAAVLVSVGILSAADPALHLAAPLDYQVIQQSDRAGGQIPIRGSVAGAAGAGLKIEARLASRAGGAGEWQPLGDAGAAGGSFALTLAAPAGGWYRLEVRAVRDGAAVAAASVAHVGIGEVFVIAGQSNSANHGEEKQVPKSGLVAAFDGKAWRLAEDPQPGASGNGGSFIPAFGDAMAARFGVPVGIVAAGAGGTSVREWLPKGARFPNPPTVMNNVVAAEGEWASKGGLFDRLAARIKPFGKGGIRAVLWHQGESDANQRDATRTLPGHLYSAYMEKLIGATRREAGWQIPWFVAQASYHTPDDPGSDDIRQAQAALWQSGVALQGPDTDALTGDLRDSGGQGVHFSAKGLRAHGAAWAQRVGDWLEAGRAAPPR